MSSRFGPKKFSPHRALEDRSQNLRVEKKVSGALPLLTFNFKDFDTVQCPPGQIFEQWEKDGLLSKLATKFVDLSQKNIVNAQQQELITIYGKFPEKSDFKCPKYIQDENIQWAVIKDIGGQLHRVAGYIIDSVFYVVFLDKDHKFYKMKNK